MGSTGPPQARSATATASRDPAAGRGSVLHAAGGNMVGHKRPSGDVYGLHRPAQPNQAAQATQGAHGARQVLAVNRLNLSNMSD